MHRKTRWAVSIIAVTAIGISTYLAYLSHQGGGSLGCGESSGFACDDVLASRWSQWLGIPVSYLAIMIYLAILIASVVGLQSTSQTAAVAETVLVAASLMAAGAAVWFILLQFALLQKLCPYCMACHTCGLLIALLVLCPMTGGAASHLPPSVRLSPGGPRRGATVASNLAAERVGHPWIPFRHLVPLVGLSLLALILGQVLVKPSTLEITDAADLADQPSDPAALTADGGSDDSSRAVLDGGSGDASAIGDKPSVDDLILGPERPTRRLQSTDGNSVGGHVPVAPTRTHEPKPAAANGNPRVAHRVDRNRPTEQDSPRATRKILLADGQVQLDVYANPVLGSPEAELVAVKLYDYTCPKCRVMHRQLEDVRGRYGNQLAVVVLPVPLNTDCNPYLTTTNRLHVDDCRYARLVLAVWSLDPVKFEEFHEWLMRGTQVPSISDATQRVTRWFGQGALNAALEDETIDRQIEAATRLFQATGKRLPVVFVKDKIIRGVPGAARELFWFFERQFHLHPVTE